MEFSHWFWYCPPRLACKWAWDSGGGSLAQTAQISRQLCPSPPCDKWDADPDLADKFMGNTTYPSLSQPASTSSLGAEGPVETTPTGTGGPDHWVAPYQIVAQERQGEASISPDLTRGLADYRTRAHRLAQRVAVAGHVDARPVGDLALEELLALGLEVQSVEAVTRPDDGVRWTYGAPYEAGVVADLSGTAAAEGRELLGVVAATVVVGGADQVRKIIGDERVYLLDLAHEHVLRNRPDITDVEQNDMYWVVAGWD
ncbi:MAG: hypothetical protein ABI562_01895 [Chloroflexota bacterium]